MKAITKLIEESNSKNLLWAHWSWNGVLSQCELINQLKKLAASGFDGVLIRPTSDMIPSFLSDNFLEKSPMKLKR